MPSSEDICQFTVSFLLLFGKKGIESGYIADALEWKFPDIDKHQVWSGIVMPYLEKRGFFTGRVGRNGYDIYSNYGKC